MSSAFPSLLRKFASVKSHVLSVPILCCSVFQGPFRERRRFWMSVVLYRRLVVLREGLDFTWVSSDCSLLLSTRCSRTPIGDQSSRPCFALGSYCFTCFSNRSRSALCSPRTPSPSKQNLWAQRAESLSLTILVFLSLTSTVQTAQVEVTFLSLYSAPISCAVRFCGPNAEGGRARGVSSGTGASARCCVLILACGNEDIWAKKCD